MMKKWLYKVAAVAIGLTMILSPMAVSARTLTEEEQAAIDAAIEDMKGIMQLIMERFLGEVTVEQLHDAALHGMTESLDPYSGYMSVSEIEEYEAYYEEYYEYYYPSYVIGIIVVEEDDGIYIEEVVEGFPAAETDLKAGDKLLFVNGNSVEGKTFEEAGKFFGSENGEPVTLVVLRGEEELTIVITPMEMDWSDVEVLDLAEYGVKDPSAKIGAIYIAEFGEFCSEDFAEAIKELKAKGAKRLILDLRDNPGGYVIPTIEICQMLVPAGTIVSTYDVDGNTTVYTSELENLPFDKIVVLVNDSTASGAEVLSSAIQDSGVGVIVGRRTYGKGIIQEIMELEDGALIKMTVEGVIRRNGEELHEAGVTPDVITTYPSFWIFSEEELTEIEEALAMAVMSEEERAALIESGELSAEELMMLEGLATLSAEELKVFENFRAENDADVAILLEMMGYQHIRQFQLDYDLPLTGILDAVTAETLSYAAIDFYYDNDVELMRAYEMLMQE